MRYLELTSILPMAMSALVASVPASQAGEIVGRVSPPESVKAVSVIQRLKNTMKQIRRNETPAELDKKTGEFVARGIAEGVYDLLIETSKGAIEGVDLSLEGGAEKALAKEDAQQVRDRIAKMDEFMNRKKPLVLTGNDRYCKALMDLRRDRVHHMGSDLIWRVEIWQFENLFGSWQLRGQGMKGRKVLHRVNASREKIEALSYLFEPRLGGIRVTGNQPVKLPPYQIPDDWEAHPGRSPASYSPKRDSS